MTGGGRHGYRRRPISRGDPGPHMGILSSRTMTFSLVVPDILVARAKAGDEEAFEALYRAFETPVYNLVRRILRTPEDAEDVLQDTFLEVMRSIRTYRGDGTLWGWIRQIAASKALMRIRREQLRSTDELVEEAAGKAAAPVGERIDLERALDQLSHTARAVVWLHDVEGYTHEEIAAALGVQEGTSKAQLSRARAKLRTMLAEYAGEWT